ncbi:MAG: DUF4981 domain-containing protein [Bacteroidales bacterium]|nr:DUF4981 domain-containing protein [Bacteroidales bacterium]
MTALLFIAATLPFWQDVQTTSINADTRRSEVIYYASREDALSKGFKESEYYINLNGVWDFKYFDDHREMPALATGLTWDKINVPGNWEVQGWGTAIYTNHPYDFCTYNPQPPTLPDAIPAAFYHRTFSVPEGWDGRDVFLNLCGIKSGTYVYVNGTEIGYCEDSKSLARFRITGALKEGENELLLKTYRYTTGSYLECQDFWRISGIERDVYLSSERTDTGFDFSVISTLDSSLQTGIFKLRMRSKQPVSVNYELIDKDGVSVANAVFEFCGQMATVTDSIPGVRHWSAETPELYTLLLKVNGEYTRFNVGFRRIEIASVKDGDRDVKALLVNGKPVKFKGVNLHEHNPYTGHWLTRENILEDLTLMRLANINAIRTCHYPQPREFYELCDSLGFYVYDESNIESHGMGYSPERTLAEKPEWYAKHIDRILNLYYRTSNYPCVTILSLGNEAGNGINFKEAYKELKALEENGQNRPVCYERAEFDWNTDMIVPQYPGADWFRWMGENYADRPVCPSEYAHAMGNSTGSLDLQWDAIYAHTHLQGGFIWDWVDQGLYDEKRVWTYGGDYGENTPSDANFLCNGIVNPDREPHPGYYEVKHVYQDISVKYDDGAFRVFNRHYFKSLDGYKLRWWIERDGRRIKKGKATLIAAPQECQSLKIKLPRMKKPGEYRIFFESVAAADMPLVAKNTVVANDEFLLAKVDRKAGKAVKPATDTTDQETRIVVRSSSAELVFDKESGNIVSYKIKGKDVVKADFGIRPNFWRGPTDNDYGNWLPYRAGAWKNAVSGVSAKLEDGTIVADYQLPRGASLNVRYTLLENGSLKVASLFKGETGGYVDFPRLGFRFHVNDDEFRYFGRGPVENYWDRNTCTFKRIWNSQASAEFYPYVRPQETGHHTETSWLRIGGITVVQGAEPFEFNALRQCVEDLDCENNVDRPYQWQYFRPDEDHTPENAAGRLRRQTHLDDIPWHDFTEVCIDYHMSGIGGYDSWGSRPETERCLWSDRSYSWDFTIVPKRGL